MANGLYIHIPFCVRKCAYCDFASFAAGRDAMERYTEELLREMALRRGDGEGAVFDTVFFGGGTPSLLPVDQMNRIVRGLRECFAISWDAEWSMEANPGTVSPDSLAAYRRMGFNRLSLGLQAAQEDLLRTLGRIHTLQDYRDAVRWARDAGFARINTDVMAGLPGQRTEDLLETLQEAYRAGCGHISMYGLQVEEGTLLARRIGAGELTLPDDDAAMDAMAAARHALEGMGYRRYEVSNYAVPGEECRHNCIYWRYGGWIGLGCAAASQWKGTRHGNPETLAAYSAWVDAGAYPEREPIGEEDAAFEAAMVGLRLADGIDRADYRRRFGPDPLDRFPALWEKYRSAGLAAWDADTLRITDAGMDVMNGILVELMEAMGI